MDRIQNLSHHRFVPKSKLVDGEMLTHSVSLRVTDSIYIYLKAKSKVLGKNQSDVILESILMDMDKDKRSGIDYIALSKMK